MDQLISNEHEDFVYQQGDALPLCAGLSQWQSQWRRIKLADEEGNVLLERSSLSPDWSPCNFLFWRYVKSLYMLPLTAKVEELKVRITNALETTTQDMLQHV